MPEYLKPLAENIPEELKQLPQSVCWRGEIRDGKPTKVPYQAANPDRKASSTDPQTWSGFDAAFRRWQAMPHRFDGVGFVLTDADPYVAFDFDKCVSGSGIDPEIEKHVKKLNSYTELSPSGTGLRVIVQASLPQPFCKNGRHECYQAGRYVTITGHALSGYPRTIEARQAEVNEVHRAIFSDRYAGTLPPADRAILEKAFKAKNGAAIKALFDGDISGHPSQSEADLAMCSHLAFWFGSEPKRIDRAFRTSGLYREKWDERHGRATYGALTIEKAIKLAGEAYEQRQQVQPQEPKEPQPERKSLRLAVLEAEDFLKKEMPEKKVYLDPWLTALAIILVTGQRGIGKSWFLLALLFAIAKRKGFGPWNALNTDPALYLDGEMAGQDAQERLLTLDSTGERESPLYIYSDAYAASQGFPRANLLNPEWRKQMKDLLLELGVKVWAVDNIASLTPGIDENSKQEWDPINQWLLELRFNEITTILAHHTNRAGGQRGTSGREDNIDISILLKHPEGYTAEDGASFITSFTKARIATPHLSKIADTAFRIELDPAGKTVWTWGTIKQRLTEQIITMHQEGMAAKDIAKDLKCSLQNVYRTIKKYENG
jgi:hypothetical protein